MANIIVAFFNGRPLSDGVLCFYGSFIKELSKTNNVMALGQNVLWNKDFPAIQEERLSAIKSFKPHLIIAFNNNFYDLAHLVDCPILVYGADTALFFSNKKQLKQNSDQYKYAVLSDSGHKCLMDLYQPKSNQVAIIPLFTAVKAQPVVQDLNISFVGSNFIDHISTDAPMFQFIKSAPSQSHIAIYKQCLNDYLQKPFLDFEQYKLENPHIPKEVLNYFNSDILNYYSASNRIKVLSQVADLGLEIFGPSTWAQDIFWESELSFCYNPSQVYTLEENENLYNRSKIGLNISHTQAINSFSWRVCDILASNACLVTENKTIIEERFSNVPLLTYSNRYEAREICKKLLENDSMREDIVLASQEAIDAKYRFKHILPLIEELTEVNLSKSKHNSLQIIEIYEKELIEIKQNTLPPAQPLKKIIYLMKTKIFKLIQYIKHTLLPRT